MQVQVRWDVLILAEAWFLLGGARPFPAQRNIDETCCGGDGSFVSQSAFEKGSCVGFVRGRGVGMGCFGATSIVSSLMILKSCFD